MCEKRVITETYQIVSPESAVDGEIERDGLYGAEEFDDVFEAVSWLKSQGAVYDGGSDWLQWMDDKIDMYTGESCMHHFHLAHFTQNEVEYIYKECGPKEKYAIDLQVKNGMWWETLTIDLDKLFKERYMETQTDLGWAARMNLRKN